MTEAFAILILVTMVGVGAYYAGWRSARAYLLAAQAVSNVTNAVASQANDFTSSLDKNSKLMESLVDANNELAEVVNERMGRQQEALEALVGGRRGSGQGGEGRSSGGFKPPRQVGEPDTGA